MKRTAITFTVSHWERMLMRARDVCHNREIRAPNRSFYSRSVIHILARRGLRRPFHYTTSVSAFQPKHMHFFNSNNNNEKTEYECARETIHFIVVWFAQRAFHLIEITFMQIWCVSPCILCLSRFLFHCVSMSSWAHSAHTAHQTNARHSRLTNGTHKTILSIERAMRRKNQIG